MSYILIINIKLIYYKLTMFTGNDKINCNFIIISTVEVFMEQVNEKNELEIDLGKIFYKMRNKFIFIIIATMVATLGSGLFTHFCVTPRYTSTVKMFVYSNTDRITTDSTITTGEISASEKLVNTYIYILKSNTVLEEVIKDLDLKITPGQLRTCISASQASDTVAFEVSVRTNSPKMSAKIANSIAKVAPKELVRVVKAGGVEIIDYATVPTRPSSPNIKKNILIAAAVAFFATFALFFIYELFDTTITNARDIEGDFEYPILGTVPTLDEIDNNTAKKQSRFAQIASDEEDNTELQLSNKVLENIQNVKGDGKNA